MPGRPPALVRRRKGEPLQVLALIVDEVKFEVPRFKFHELAVGGALDAFPQAFADALYFDWAYSGTGRTVALAGLPAAAVAVGLVLLANSPPS